MDGGTDRYSVNYNKIHIRFVCNRHTAKTAHLSEIEE